MPLQTLVTDKITVDVNISLEAGYDLFVAKGVNAASSKSSVVVATAGSSNVEVQGTLIAGDAAAIYMGDSTADTGYHVSVGTEGYIRNFGLHAAIEMMGSATKIESRGEIAGAQMGIQFGGDVLAGYQSTLINDGMIEGGSFAIRRTPFTDGKVVVENDGTIVGGVASYQAAQGDEGGVDLVTNRGKMLGDVHLGSGEDLYDGRFGSVEGTVLGGAGADRLYGGAEANLFDGGADGDIIHGGKGADQMIGGEGSADDTFYVDNAGDEVIESDGGGTADRVNSSVSFNLGLHGQWVEILDLTGTGNTNGTGNGRANTVYGNDANNVLNGMTGSDRLIGFDGKDAFFFNTKLNANTNVDTIADFSVTSGDTIRLENAKFTKIVGTGVLTAAEFVKNGDGVAKELDDRIVYDTSDGHLYYDSNGSESGGRVLFAIVENKAALTAADFFVV